MRTSVVVPVVTMLVTTGYWVLRRRRGDPPAAGRLLLGAALVSTVAIGLLLLPSLEAGHGTALRLFAPTALVAAAVLAERLSTRAGVVAAWLAAASTTVYVLLAGVEVGTSYGTVPLLLVLAASTLGGPGRRASKRPARKLRRTVGLTHSRRS